MKRHLTFFAALFVAGAVMAAEPIQKDLEIINTTPDGKGVLYRQEIANPGDGADTAIYIADVRGSYAEMGQQYGYLLSKDHLPAAYQNLSLQSFSQDVQAKTPWILDKTLYKLVTEDSKKRIPDQEMQMIQGESVGSGMQVDDLIRLDQMFLFTFLAHLQKSKSPQEIAAIFRNPAAMKNLAAADAPFGCSTIAVWGDYTQDHKMLFGRNFDWAKYVHSAFTNRLVVGIFHPNDANAVAIIGYPGWFFSDTAMNDHGLLLEMNSGWYSSYSMNLLPPDPKDPTNPKKGTYSYFDVLTNYLFAANDYADLHKMIRESNPDISYVMIGTDGKKIFAAEEVPQSIATARAVRMRVPQDQVQYPKDEYLSNYKEDPVNENVLVVSNSFRLADWRKYLPFQYLPWSPYPKDEDTSYPLTRYNNLMTLAKTQKGVITLDTMKNIMERPLIHEGLGGGATGYESDDDSMSLTKASARTYFSLVAEPDQFIWWLRMPAKAKHGAMDDGWVKVDLKPFFAVSE